MKTIRYALLITTSSLLLAVSALADDTNLEALKSSYATQTANIDDDAHAALARLNASYGRSLDKAIAALRKKGDPEQVITAVAEKNRFAKEKTVPNPPDTKLPKMVHAVQSKYHDAVANAETKKNRRRAALMEKYVVALDRLMRQHTSAGKMDLAMEVKKEKEHAEFVQADMATSLTKAREQSKLADHRRLRAQLPEDAVEWNGHHYKAYSKKPSRHVQRLSGSRSGVKRMRGLPNKRAWHDAKIKCEEMGGHLVVITSAAENTFLVSLVASRGRWWLGATDEKEDTKWVWVDGTPMSYSHWFRANRKKGWNARPRTGNTYNYLQMAFGRSGTWDSVAQIASETGYICEWDF